MMNDIASYRDFIASKGTSAKTVGFAPHGLLKMARKYIGVELKPEYAAQANRFLAEAEASQMTLFFSQAAE